MKVNTIDYILPPVSLVMIVIYHLYFIYKYFNSPHQVNLALNIQVKTN